MTTTDTQDPLLIAGKTYHSRLLVGSGKYKDLAQTRAATLASGAQIITVALRRTNIGQNPGEPNLLDVVPPEEFTILPNTAGCYSAEDALRTCRLARELLDGHTLVKLEVLGDEKTLYPDVVQTLQAAEVLVNDTSGFCTRSIIVAICSITSGEPGPSTATTSSPRYTPTLFAST